MKTPLDKQAHALGGAVITLATSMALLPVLGLWTALACALLAAMVIGALKELYDYHYPLTHTCDFYDWLATTLGGLAGCLWVLVPLAVRGLP